MMKKLYFLAKAIMPLFMSACVLVACEKGGGTEPDPDDSNKPGSVTKPEDLSNQAAYNGSVFSLQSVIYTFEEVEGSAVFYLSPTAGITDIDGMQAANDYIRLVVGKTNGSNVNFAGTDNAVVYNDLQADASNASQFKITKLDVILYGATAVEIQINIASNDGRSTLLTNYYGSCTRYPSDDIAIEAVAVCTHVAQQVYFGQGLGTNAHEYDLLVSTSQLTQATDGTLVLLEETGYAMHIAFFAIPNSVYRTRLPQGTYKYSEGAEAGTYLSVSYLAEFSTENGHQEMSTRPFVGDMTVTTDNNDITTIRASFVDSSNRLRTIAYQGKLGNFMDINSSTYLPQFNQDVDMTANKANGIYYGRMGEQAYGTFELVIYENAYLDGQEGSFGATLLLTSPTLFTKEADLKQNISKLNGTYNASSTFSQSMSWFKPVEMNVYGMVQPYGTFLHQYDGSYYGLFGYANDGTVTISAGSADGDMHIEFDLTSQNGSKMKGRYDGPIEWSWQPVSSDSDDGTSTLTEDYDMDLARHKEARLVVPQQIYIGGIGYTQMSDYSKRWGSQSPDKNDDIGYQYIAFGNIGLNEDPVGTVNAGDFAYIELVTAPGEERQLKPGHYTISPQRWPAYFHPMNSDGEGVAVKGMLLNSISYTSHWEHHYASDGGLSVIDGHAYFYGGEVTVSGPDADGEYTFEFDCLCVRDHHVRGTWKGPVSGISTETDTAMWRAPMLTEDQLLARTSKWSVSGMRSQDARRLPQQSAAAETPAYGRLSLTR